MLINLPRARALIAEAGLDAVVLVTSPNITYASDVASEYMLGGFDDYTHAVVLPAREDIAPALVVPDNDLPHIAECASWIDDVHPYGNPWSSIGQFIGQTLEDHLGTPFRDRLHALRRRTAQRQAGTLVEALVGALAERGLQRARIGCDDMPMARMLQERAIGASPGIAYIRQLMRTIRAVKTPEEVDVLARAAEINAAALQRAAQQARAGMRETDLIRSWRTALAELDAHHVGERGMLFGSGDASTFYLPSDSRRTLQPGEAVVLDCIGCYKRYFMDVARTAVVGEPTDKQRLRHRAVATAIGATVDATRPGVHTADLAALMRRTLEGFGLPSDTTSTLTHGIGLEVFEFPTEDGLASGFALEEGMVVNSEVFYRDIELGGFHLEDTVIVTRSGCRVLADLSRELYRI